MLNYQRVYIFLVGIFTYELPNGTYYTTKLLAPQVADVKVERRLETGNDPQSTDKNGLIWYENQWSWVQPRLHQP